MEVDISVVAQRLIHLRKHLGERLGEKLTIQEVADRAGIPEHKMIRLEHGKGTLETFIALLLYYRSQNYNLDWILFPENANVPLMVASGKDLLLVSEMIQRLSLRLQQDYREISSQLKMLGYSPLEEQHFTPSEAATPEAFDFSA